MNLWSVAVRNTMRNKVRTIMTLAGGIVAILAFLTLRTVVGAFWVGVENSAKDRLATRHKVTFIMQLPKRYIDVVRGVHGVKAATWANWFGAKDPNNPDNFFANYAVDPQSFLEVYDEVLVPADQKKAWFEDRRGALLGDVLARQLKVKIGDKVRLSGTIYPGDWEFNVSGIYTPARKSVDRSQFIFHWDYLNESLRPQHKDKIGWIASRIDDPGRGAAISAEVDRIFDEKDVQTATMSEKQMQLSFMAMLSAIMKALDIVSVIILLIMMMILGNTIAMGVRERTNEYGVLRAIGFSPGHVRAFIIGEAVTLGLLVGVIGAALAYPLVELGMGGFLEENFGAWFPYFRLSRTSIAAGIGLAVVLSVTAASLPARRAARLNVTDALRRVV